MKKFEDIFSRVDRMHERVGQTDGRTYTGPQQRLNAVGVVKLHAYQKANDAAAVCICVLNVGSVIYNLRN